MSFAVTWPAVVYALVFALHLVLPARHVEGYVRDAGGKPLRYRLNGLLVFLATVGAWALVCRAGWLEWDAFFVHSPEHPRWLELDEDDARAVSVLNDLSFLQPAGAVLKDS